MNDNVINISLKTIYNYYLEKFSINHPFLDDSTLDYSKKFLESLAGVDKEHNEPERIKILSELSDLVVDLWAMMLENALKIINDADGIKPNDTIKGINNLKDYIKKFKEFEMLLYGSDKWYRDTVYHQLWFYFVGEFLFSKFNIFEKIMKSNFNWYCTLKSDEIEEKKKAMYASFCIIALCHDLGKPLEKIHSINDSIRKMVENYKFLHINSFKIEFPLTYNNMLNYLIERLSQSGRPDKPDNKKDGYFKIINWNKLKKDTDIKNPWGVDPLFIKMQGELKKLPYLEGNLSSQLSNLNHGMLSCLLLMESFRRFVDGEIINIPNDDKDMDSDCKGVWIQKSYLSSNEILKAIAYHNINNIIIVDQKLPNFWVCLVDDLVESYRPTRAGKDFISIGICDVQIVKFSLNKIHVRYTFDREMSKDDKKEIMGVIHFFIDKLERYYLILEIEGFKFIIDVKMNNIIDNENQNCSVLMQYQYNKINEEKQSRITYKRNKTEIELEKNGKIILDEENYIKPLLLNGLEKSKKEIYKDIFKNKNRSIF